MNWFLIVIFIIVFAVLLFGNIMFLIYFQHEEDKNGAVFCKAVVVLGLTLATSTVLLMPLDIANRADPLFDMTVMWQAVYMCMFVFCFILIPFAIFFYEADLDLKLGKQITSAVLYTFATFFIAALLVIILWATLGFVELPLDTHYGTLHAADSPLGAKEWQTAVDESCGGVVKGEAQFCPNTFCGLRKCTMATNIISYKVSIPTYVIAMLAFFGWFLFMFFGGIGLVALPVDLINAWRTRPKPIDVTEFAKKKIELKERSGKLLQQGREFEHTQRMKGVSKRKERTFLNNFKAQVYGLEEDHTKLNRAYKERGGNPFVPWLKLVLGVFGCAISLSWLVQVVVWMSTDPPMAPFLNQVFIDLDAAFPLFGIGAYASFSFWLLWCVLKGQIKFGMRFFIVSIHPMKIGETMMNSMLFNTGMLLLCTTAVVQFCSRAFSGFASGTAIDVLFSNQIQNLKFLGFFYQNNIFIWVFFGCAALTLILGITAPFLGKKRQPETLDEMLDGM